MKTYHEILAERAKLVEGKRSTSVVKENLISVIEFELFPEKYAMSDEFATEVLLLKDFTPIPGAPFFVMGVINLRGRIVSIINLKKLLDIKEHGLTQMNKVIVLRNDHMEFGIVADAILGANTISIDDLCPPPSNLNRAGEFIQAVTHEGTILLNTDRLLNSNYITTI